ASMVAFFIAGAMLGARAWRDAWRPPLRTAFEALARRERDQANREGRRLPEDDEAFATVHGTLRADGAQTESGVSLSIDVEGLDGREGQDRPLGGLIVTVAGALAADRVGEWRAGRRVRLPVLLRRPSRSLNPDVPALVP